MRRRLLIGLLIGIGVLLVLPFALPTGDADARDPRTLADDNGQFIAIGGLDTYIEQTGDPAGRPLLLIHGLFGSTEVWRFVADGLGQAGYRVIAYDRPGAGLSAKPLDAAYSQPAHADHAAAVLDALGIGQAVIVGHSAGGNVAAHFALRHPSRTAGLVLVDAAVLAGGPPAFVGGIVAFPPLTRWIQVILPAVLTRPTLEDTLRGFYADPDAVDAAWVDAYWRAFETPGAYNGLIGLTRDAAPNRLTETQIAGITAPTQVIWGELDTVTPLAQGEALAALIAGSQLTVIAEAGHQPMEERPPAFIEALSGL